MCPYFTHYAETIANQAENIDWLNMTQRAEAHAWAIDFLLRSLGDKFDNELRTRLILIEIPVLQHRTKLPRSLNRTL